MSDVGSYEAKTHLPRLLKRVAKGERFVITLHGVPAAMLVPATPSASRPVSEVISDLKSFRASIRLRGLSLRKLIHEGRE